VSFNMRWLGTACFELVLQDGKHLLIDPFMDDSINSPTKADQIEACDYMFLTHGHWDHVLDVGKITRRFAPPVYCNQAAAESVTRLQGVDKDLITVLGAGDAATLPGFKAEVLRGVHTNPVTEYKRITGRAMPPADSFTSPLERARELLLETSGTDQIQERHLEWRSSYPGGKQLNFVFELADGQRIYMAGSYPDPLVVEAAGNARADITLMQCMSSNKLKGLEKATAEVILASGCKTAIPQHHDPIYAGGRQTDLSELKGLVEDAGIVFMEMTPGDWYQFVDGVALGHHPSL
jgi:L-ascorbate metabolism protein UlaG (beta-lactamase superfamily)